MVEIEDTAAVANLKARVQAMRSQREPRVAQSRCATRGFVSHTRAVRHQGTCRAADRFAESNIMRVLICLHVHSAGICVTMLLGACLSTQARFCGRRDYMSCIYPHIIPPAHLIKADATAGRTRICSLCHWTWAAQCTQRAGKRLQQCPSRGLRACLLEMCTYQGRARTFASWTEMHRCMHSLTAPFEKLQLSRGRKAQILSRSSCIARSSCQCVQSGHRDEAAVDDLSDDMAS